METLILVYGLPADETERWTESLLLTAPDDAEAEAKVARVKVLAGNDGWHDFRVTKSDGSPPDFAGAVTGWVIMKMSDKVSDKVIAAVHRFRDEIAISVGNGESTYFSIGEAKRLAAAIRKIAKDIENVDYGDSKVGSTTIFRISH